jgi:hypothetical protein
LGSSGGQNKPGSFIRELSGTEGTGPVDMRAGVPCRKPPAMSTESGAGADPIGSYVLFSPYWLFAIWNRVIGER